MINKYCFIGFTVLHVIMCFVWLLNMTIAQRRYYIPRPFHTGLKLCLGGVMGAFLREVWVLAYIDTITLDWSTWIIKIAMTLLILVAINYIRTAVHYSK